MPVPRRTIPVLLTLVVVFLYWRLTSPSPKMGSLRADGPIRLAILMADTPQPQTNAQYGGYDAVFTSLLTRACQSFDPPQELSQQVTISSYHVVDNKDAYPDLDDVDAILITGSKHDAFADDPWIVNLTEYTKKAIDTARVRVVGVCFGHQIVGRAAGVRVGRSDSNWEISVTEVELTDKGKEIFQLDRMRIQQMHHDIVFDFPPDSFPLGSSPFCTVESMYRPGRYITVQGHPEFTSEIVTEVIENRRKAGVFDDALYKSGIDRAGKDHDGVAIARAFLRFMRDG